MCVETYGTTTSDLLAEDVEETVAILGLLHDVCKVGVYHQTDPFKDIAEGNLAAVGLYEFRTPSPWATERKACT